MNYLKSLSFFGLSLYFFVIGFEKGERINIIIGLVIVIFSFIMLLSNESKLFKSILSLCEIVIVLALFVWGIVGLIADHSSFYILFILVALLLLFQNIIPLLRSYRNRNDTTKCKQTPDEALKRMRKK